VFITKLLFVRSALANKPLPGIGFIRIDRHKLLILKKLVNVLAKHFGYPSLFSLVEPVATTQMQGQITLGDPNLFGQLCLGNVRTKKSGFEKYVPFHV
jgi:hypothetical protein